MYANTQTQSWNANFGISSQRHLLMKIQKEEESEISIDQALLQNPTAFERYIQHYLQFRNMILSLNSSNAMGNTSHSDGNSESLQPGMIQPIGIQLNESFMVDEMTEVPPNERQQTEVRQNQDPQRNQQSQSQIRGSHTRGKDNEDVIDLSGEPSRKRLKS